MRLQEYISVRSRFAQKVSGTATASTVEKVFTSHWWRFHHDDILYLIIWNTICIIDRSFLLSRLLLPPEGREIFVSRLAGGFVSSWCEMSEWWSDVFTIFSSALDSFIASSNSTWACWRLRWWCCVFMSRQSLRAREPFGNNFFFSLFFKSMTGVKTPWACIHRHLPFTPRVM